MVSDALIAAGITAAVQLLLELAKTRPLTDAEKARIVQAMDGNEAAHAAIQDAYKQGYHK